MLTIILIIVIKVFLFQQLKKKCVGNHYCMFCIICVCSGRSFRWLPARGGRSCARSLFTSLPSHVSSGRSTSSLTAQQRRSNKVSPALPSPSPASLALPPPLPHPALSACLPPAPSPSVPSRSPCVPSGLFCCLWNDHIPLTDSCLLYSAMHILMFLLPPHRWFILSF